MSLYSKNSSKYCLLHYGLSNKVVHTEFHIIEILKYMSYCLVNKQVDLQQLPNMAAEYKVATISKTGKPRKRGKNFFFFEPEYIKV